MRSFAECGQNAFVFESVDRPGEYSVGGSACHDRFCVPCSRDRSRVIAQNVLEQIDSRQGRFITLTLKSTSEPLRVLLARLTHSFTKLRRTRLWRNKVVGGVAFIEVTWASGSQSWHPHFHCLVEGRYLPRRELSSLWFSITGDSYITDIRFARDNRHVTHYITKYATKCLDHSVLDEPEHLQEAILALKGKRLCLTFGTWRGVCLTKRIEDGTWIQLGSLAHFLTQASAGDLQAGSILDALEIRYVISERGPPSPTVTDVSGSRQVQCMLNYNAEFRTPWDVN
ncbi:MAG: protein rep [Phycisphaerae bacterium]|nr:protein rep [Phycisphaerae bacterium]